MDPEPNGAGAGQSAEAASRESVKTLHRIIMALAITNALRVFVGEHSRNDAISRLSDFDVSGTEVLTLIVAVIFLFRFYLGDSSYLATHEMTSQVEYLFDALNILGNSLLLAFMSFFVTDSASVILLVFFVLSWEVLWWLTKLVMGTADTTEDGLQLSFVFSILTIVVMVVLRAALRENGERWSDIRLSNRATQWFNVVLLLNIALDALTRGPSYFGFDAKYKVKFWK